MEESDQGSELRRQVEDLRASRARIMKTANGERRNIERLLHDGVQQDLIALAVNLQLAEVLGGSDPVALMSRLAEIRRDVRDAIDGVRALARGIYPPLLDDLGLAEALHGAASGVRIPVRIEAAVDRYPPDIEATVYFCCLAALEAMAPLEPHGGATLRVWREPESLAFEILIEGGAAARDASVLNSLRTEMNDRVGPVDGSLTVLAESECTRVRGTIPLGDSLTDSRLDTG